MKIPPLHLLARHRHYPFSIKAVFITGIALSLLLLTFSVLVVNPAAAQTSPQDNLVEVLSYEDTTCYYLTWKDSEIDPVKNAYKTVDIAITIPYTGVIEEATLLLRSANVRAEGIHPIVINGVDTGYTPPYSDGYPTCDAPRPAIREYPLDLTVVPIHPGVNTVRLTTEGTTDIWGADYIAIRVRGYDIKGGHFESIVFPGENGQDVNAELLLPDDMQPDSPLLVLFHGWRGTPIEPFFTDYTPAALEQGWIVASPQQRGQNALGPGGQPLASLRSQHDAIKLVAYMKSHYQIDPDRIYVGGFSMGGMMAGMMAAKYPDTFAAAVTHMAITDLRDWYYEAGEYRQSQIITETGGAPYEIPFEYDRRSPKELASNLKNTPIAVVHGISDTVVPPHHAQDFYDAIEANDPVRAELRWYPGGHDPSQTPPVGGVWAVNFMKDYSLNENPTNLRIRTDESKSYYWLTITAHKSDPWRSFTRVDVDVQPADERILATVNDVQPVDLSFDLVKMNLDSHVSYVVSQTNDLLGSSIQAVTPLNGHLNITAPQGATQLEIFPNRGDMPVEVVLRRGKDGYDGVQDAWINQWSPDANYGASNNINLRPGAVQRGLLRFDLENLLPDNIRITSANLYLYDSSDDPDSPDMTVEFHHLGRNWSESEVTYNRAETGQQWTHQGGDFDAAPVASINLAGSQPRYVSINILDSVRAWVADPSSNHGLLLNVSQSSNNKARFIRSSEFWEQEQRPWLKIIYQPIPFGEVSGVVYEDANRNRQYDAGEPLLAGAVVALQQNGVTLSQQTTGVDGAYHFDQLTSGSYQLHETPPSGFAPAQPTGNIFFTISNGDALTFNFGHDPRLYLPIITR